MLEIYEKYLTNIDKSIQEFFEQQKPYIFCKKGCSLCCEEGTYPFTQLEFEFLMSGYNKLTSEEKNLIRKRIKKIKKEKEASGNKKFMYRCPFLMKKQCCIYKYRGIICRSHGLMYHTTDKTDKRLYGIPACINNNLNYSNVFDEKTNSISAEKWKKTGIITEPLAYNVNIKFLTNNETTHLLKLEFGEEKSLIDWF